MRVGLDLLYLVPGETGGRETYARELVPALLELRPRAGARGVRQPRRRTGAGRRARRRGARRGRPCLRTQPSAVGARRARAGVAGRPSRARASCCTRWPTSRPPGGRFRRVVTIHDLQYRAVPELMSWPMRTGTSALVSLAARARTSDHRRLAAALAGRSVAGLGVERERIDVVPQRRAPAVGAGARPDGRAARAPTDSAGGRSRWRWPPTSLTRTCPR